MQKLNILIASLNWGLGHATRSIPVIRKLKSDGHQLILASDGKALEFLKKEFPDLKAYQLCSSEVIYAKHNLEMRLRLLQGSFKMLRNTKREMKITRQICKAEKIDCIISDNRLGIRHKTIKSIVMSHQLNLKMHHFGWLPQRIYRHFLNKFDDIWIPDTRGEMKISGRLSDWKTTDHKTQYIGLCSALEKKDTPLQYQFCILLSGPEPQRSLLEEKLLAIFFKKNTSAIMIAGKVEEKQKISHQNKLTYVNYMTSAELSKTLNESAYIICRSGYSSLMDVALLKKKAFLIPTPQQPEQIYLAKYLKEKQIADFCFQDQLTDQNFENIDPVYQGFTKITAQESALILPQLLSK
ncbi:MAG: glycosyltransferase [Psychroflexus sp.]|nr:glycosyltransferase [Psychroflexus sp.]MDN6309062.1 glycosyltransferase [Psychroflexus sp.]